jgi:purine-binding chemotaxis protein CheW
LRPGTLEAGGGGVAMSEESTVAARERELLKERARALARPIKAIVHSSSRGMVVFSLGDERYAIETRYVHTAQRLPRITPLPGTAAHVVGLASAYGELLVVFDLRALLGTARPAHSESSRMLLLGEHGAELAIIADSVHDVQQLQDLEVFELPAATAEDLRPYLCGVTSQGISIFDGAALLASAQLYVDDSSEASVL